MPKRPKKISRLIIYRVISLASSRRVATESRIDLADVAFKAVLVRLSRNNDARGNNNRGGSTNSWPERSRANPSIQLTELAIEKI